MGPIETLLRVSCEDALDEINVVAQIGVNNEARHVVYGAAMWINNGTPMGISGIVHCGILPDVLTEAICAAEALEL